MGHRVLFCSCGNSDVIPEATRREALAAVSASSAEVVTVNDLCGLAARQDPRLRALTDAPLAIVACRERAVRWLLAAAGVTLAEGSTLLDMHTRTPEEITRALSGDGCCASSSSVAWLDGADTWIPWFPIIDHDRCSSCQQCASFCLFGVFEIAADGGVRVAQPTSCKNNCPACARVCPEAAIIFPKLGEAPINGAEVTDEEAQRERIQVDVQRMLGDDIYAALAERRRKAKQRLLRRRQVDQALAERERCSSSSDDGLVQIGEGP